MAESGEQKIKIIAYDMAAPDERGEHEIMDDYVLVTAGRCERTYVQVSRAKDGTETHVITVRGIRRG